MAIFKYTLPSGAKFTMNAPTGTTQAEADKIFYEQVAAGTFVGYKAGDTLSHPVEALTNFGITRLQRGTAGVKDNTTLAINSGLPVIFPPGSAGVNRGNNQANTTVTNAALDANTLLAITSTLPIVASLPNLSSVPIENAITQVNYIQVNSNPTVGLISQGAVPIAGLNSTQIQALMAQLAAAVSQPYNIITQEKGVGRFGFNSQQLERAGYIKPGYSQRYCRIDPSTQANPSNFVSFMQSPSPWSGLDGVTSVNDILTNEALQNQIQQELMLQSYHAFVSNGVIQPKNNTPPPPTVAQVYTSSGVLASASTTSLLTDTLGTK